MLKKINIEIFHHRFHVQPKVDLVSVSNSGFNLDSISIDNDDEEDSFMLTVFQKKIFFFQYSLFLYNYKDFIYCLSN